MSRIGGRLALLVVLPLPGTLGCPGTCVGAGCEEEFDASFAGVFFGAASTPSQLSPLTPDLAIIGGVDEGPDWDVAVAADTFLVGSPGDGTVRSFQVGGASTMASSEASGWLAQQDGDVEDFGGEIEILADLDLDGVAELLVGAPRADIGTAHDEGAVYLYSGRGAGFEGVLTDTTPRLRVGGESTSVHFGDELEACGDMDGDLLPEWAASAPLASRAEDAQLAGEVALASSQDWMSLDAEVLMGGLGVGSSSEVRHGGVFWGSVTGARAGSALSCRHDVTGDGLADLWIGAPFADGTHDAEGAVYLVTSGAKGPPAVGDLEASGLAVLRGEVEEAWFGSSVGTGLLDNDLLADIAIGAPGASAQSGTADDAIHPGEVLLWFGDTFQADPTSRPDVRITGAEDGDRFGSTVTFGDVDGDGFDDLLVGAPHHNPDSQDAGSAFQSGALYVFKGGSELLTFRANMTARDADLVFVEPEQFLRTGARVSTGDYDSDTRDEVVIVNRYDPGESPFE